MKSMGWVIAMYLVCGFCFAKQAIAMRCGSVLIGVGSTVEQVLENCGQPMKKEVFEQRKSGTRMADRRKTGVSYVEHWTYDTPGDSLTVLHFLDGRVIRVEARPRWLESNPQPQGGQGALP